MPSSSVSFPWSDQEAQALVKAAVKHYWAVRGGQSRKQQASGTSDQGSRGEVTGGKHLDGFVDLLCKVIRAAGFSDSEIRFKSGVELPGYYRPTKQWDILVIRGDRLCAAVEMKSQVGPSFGNNFNNRSEEAIGSSTDFWVAYREGLLGKQQPWLGYFLLVEEAKGSTGPVRLAKAVFEPMPSFLNTSYMQRYTILCQRLLLERNYTSAALVASPRGDEGAFSEPAEELRFLALAKSLFGHLVGLA